MEAEYVIANSHPSPIWPDAPRHCPGTPFPPYSYIPGKNPHPVTHPRGHAYGRTHAPAPLVVDNWRENSDYLFGIDLYHYGYLWEAHEAWEGLWRQATDQSPESLLLRALIQNSAAQLKARTNKARGVRTLSMRVGGFLTSLNEQIPGEFFMGVNVSELLDAVRAHYRPMWATYTPQDVVLAGDPPKIVVT